MPAKLFRLPGAIALSAALVLVSAIAVPAGADVAPTAYPSPAFSPAPATITEPVVDMPDPTILTESLALGTTYWSYRPAAFGDFGTEDLDVIGSVGQGRPLQAIRVWRGSTFADQRPVVYADDKMNLRAHVSGLGWLPEVHGGDASIGTEGEGRTLEAFTFSISGIWSTLYDVYYRAHVSNLGWLGWAKNGEAAGTTGYGYPIEAVQITIVHEGSAAPAGTGMPASLDRFLQSQLSVRAHVQNVGWMAPVAGGQTAGTEGRSLRVEALRFGVGVDVPGGIEASAHVQNLGWQPFAGTGGLVGTEGQGLRVEAFRIRLTGQLAETYDVYYRTHAQEFGWLGWAKNGEDSGTAGYSYRLEAVQVVLVPKGGSAPSGTGSAFHQR